jgi:hypothetical protein
VVLDQDFELSMDGDGRQPSIAGLLQSFDEERTVAALCQDVRVEVRPFDALGVGQDDLPDTERRELGPQPPHHFRPWDREQEIDARSRGRGGLEYALHRHATALRRLDRADTERPVESSDANRLARDDLQHLQQVIGARIAERHPVRVLEVTFVDEDKVHARRMS